MEDLARLVARSMARHGMDIPVDHRRLQWSKWFRCESSFDLLLVPSKPGLFALAEEIVAPGETPVAAGKRMLAIFQVSEAGDLGIAMVRLFAPGTALSARLAVGRIFARYTVIEDASQRSSAHAALQRWLAASAETASGMIGDHNLQPVPAAPVLDHEASLAGRSGPNETKGIQRPSSLPAGF